MDNEKGQPIPSHAGSCGDAELTLRMHGNVTWPLAVTAPVREKPLSINLALVDEMVMSSDILSCLLLNSGF